MADRHRQPAHIRGDHRGTAGLRLQGHEPDDSLKDGTATTSALRKVAASSAGSTGGESATTSSRPSCVASAGRSSSAAPLASPVMEIRSRMSGRCRRSSAAAANSTCGPLSAWIGRRTPGGRSSGPMPAAAGSCCRPSGRNVRRSTPGGITSTVPRRRRRGRPARTPRSACSRSAGPPRRQWLFAADPGFRLRCLAGLQVKVLDQPHGVHRMHQRNLPVLPAGQSHRTGEPIVRVQHVVPAAVGWLNWRSGASSAASRCGTSSLATVSAGAPSKWITRTPARDAPPVPGRHVGERVKTSTAVPSAACSLAKART